MSSLKYYIKKYPKTIRLSALFAFLLALFVFSFNYSSETISSIDLSVYRNGKLIPTTESYINMDDVNKILKKYEIEYNRSYQEINFESLEKEITALKFISEVKAVATTNGKIKIKLIEITPFARVINSKGEDFLVDQSGKMIGKSVLKLDYLPIINGHIKQSFDFNQFISDDYLAQSIDILKTFQKYPYFSSQIGNVYVSRNHDALVYLTVAGKTVNIGDNKDLDNKIERLYIFLKEIRPEINYDFSSMITVKFNNQVIINKI